MTDTIEHIICGGAGSEIGEKSIVIHDHTILNAAVHLKHEALASFYETQGMDADKAHKKALRLGKRIQRFWDDLYADLEADGVEAYTYPVNPANLG